MCGPISPRTCRRAGPFPAPGFEPTEPPIPVEIVGRPLRNLRRLCQHAPSGARLKQQVKHAT